MRLRASGIFAWRSPAANRVRRERCHPWRRFCPRRRQRVALPTPRLAIRVSGTALQLAL